MLHSKNKEILGFARYFFYLSFAELNWYRTNNSNGGICFLKSKMIWRVFLIFSTVIFLMFGTLSFADGEEKAVEFSVKAIIPENQIDKNQTYFDLKMEPLKSQKIEVEVYNASSRDIDVKVDLANATTNSNALIVYDEPEKAPDESLTNPLTTIAALNDVQGGKIKVPAGSSTVVSATINMPESEFDGMILGAMRFEKLPDKESGENNSGGVSIQNKYAYVIGIKLTENENRVKPDMILKQVKSGLENYKTATTAVLQNPTSSIIRNLKIHGQVLKKGSDEVLHKAEIENGSFAPNSTMDFIVDWEYKPLKAGDYVFRGTAEDGENTWNFEKEFSIAEEEAEAANEKAVEIERDYTWIFVLAVAVLISIIAALIMYIRKIKREAAN